MVMGIGSTLNWVVLYFFSDPLVVWVFGPKWASAIPVFQAFGCLSLAYTAYNLSAAILLAREAYRALAVGRLAGLLFFGITVCWIIVTSEVSEVNIAYSLCMAMMATGVFCIIARIFLHDSN